MNFKYCVFLIISVLFLSCKNKNATMEQIARMQSDVVVLPLDSMNNTGVSPCVPRLDGYKFIVYSDSSDCSSCSLRKLYQWDELSELSKRYGDGVQFIFIFSPSKKNQGLFELAIRNVLSSSLIYMDTINIFSRLNPHIPGERRFHTFLLDEDNNVLLVGNPLENEKIKELFWQIVEERLGKRE